MKLLIEINEKVYFRNSLVFIDYAKAFDKVKRRKFLDILQGKKYSIFSIKKCNRNLLWKRNKVKINNKLSKGTTINRRVRKVCPLSPTVLNM